jgi:predicted aconitase/predicted aconitase with swiveling domain
MLMGDEGLARQMAMRLVLDMAAAAGAEELVPIESAHLSGVSPLTGGLGLIQFLRKVASDEGAQVAVPTTLNAAGCDASQFEAMRINIPGYLEQSQEIVALYVQLGVRPTQSCIPYEWEGVVTRGAAAWAESNAICFGNSYCGLMTNRESGLSAFASALTGYAPRYGLLLEDNRRPNLEVIVSCPLDDPTDFSILGDWIGKQRLPSWRMPFGPIPLIRGLPDQLSHEQRKALSAAAANYGSPLLYVEGHGEAPEPAGNVPSLSFTDDDLQRRYSELRPLAPVSLITIGCPQASVGELRAAAELLKGRSVSSDPEDGSGRPPLWIFTSTANKEIAERTGLAEIITNSGALLLADTCPEVVPYDQNWVRHILTNSMKAEHYLKSGLNNIPTSVMRLADCIDLAERGAEQGARGKGKVAGGKERVAGGEEQGAGDMGQIGSTDLTPSPHHPITRSPHHPFTPSPAHPFTATGRGLPSQGDFTVTGEAFVTDAPITFLGFVNRESGVVEEPGHPANGRSMAGKIAIFPKGTGSTVAPYVLLELYYRGMAPIAIVNSEIDQQSAPACSLEGIPYAYDFDADIIAAANNGDVVELSRRDETVTLRVLSSREDANRQVDLR